MVAYLDRNVNQTMNIILGKKFKQFSAGMFCSTRELVLGLSTKYKKTEQYVEAENSRSSVASVLRLSSSLFFATTVAL